MQNNSPFESNNHTKQEIILFDLLTNLALIIPAIFLVTFFRRILAVLPVKDFIRSVYYGLFYTVGLRGPPRYLIS